MHIVIATPLYPPDIAEPAPYTKELARRLSKHHRITIITYGEYPEMIPGVTIVAIPKRHALPIRLTRLSIALIRHARHADVLYLNNGASVELPAAVVSLMVPIPLIIHTSDARANIASTKGLRGMVARFVQRRARHMFSFPPMPRPEILPFEQRPEEALARYERWWHTQITEVERILTYV